ncbi:hypothetical protein SDC9_68294 [bioreactor metagenome]|uniref:Pectinacetylesterase n=1 Tax=bioreactor metagenome TaxID=1076179 RepID=A0A644Y6U8_9ZZZZ
MKQLIALITLPIVMLNALLHRVRRFPGTFRREKTWYRLPLEGAVGSDGSPYYAYVRKGTVNKTLLHFSGGGASWNEYTAARPTTLWRAIWTKESFYFPYVKRFLELGMTGLVAQNDPQNPVNDWNMIYLPYATADFHTGDNDFPYIALNKKPKVLRHHGARNMRLVLDAAPRELFAAEEIMIAGESAGGFAAIAMADEVARYFPARKSIYVVCDGAQLRYPDWKSVISEVWGASTDRYDFLSDDGQLVLGWFLRIAEIDGIRPQLLHLVSPRDRVLAAYERFANGRGAFEADAASFAAFQEGLCQTVHELTERLPNYRCYIYDHEREADGGTGHTIIRTPKYFYAPQRSISAADWIRAVLEGKPAEHKGLELLDERKASVQAALDA